MALDICLYQTKKEVAEIWIINIVSLIKIFRVRTYSQFLELVFNLLYII